MNWQTVADALFPQGHRIVERDLFLSGDAQVGGQTVTVIGTTGHTPIGVEIALAQATVLGKCVELARRSGHRIIGLVYDQALSGGFITSGLIADACYALPDATIRVMGLPAMARITKVPLERLEELALDNPVFAPGAENYLRMGGVAAIWHDDLAASLARALAQAEPVDRRAELGLERGGRKLARPVAVAVRTGSDVQAA
jgi:malonate decarboxylase gamma subunit